MFCPIKQDNTAFQNEFVDVCSTDDDDKENRPPNAQARGQNSASNYLTATSSSMLPPINHSHEHFVTKCEESFSQLSSSAVNDKEAESEEDSEKITSRKEKSLGKLCKRFLLAMGEEATNGNDVHLETVAKKMCVEKRRIYDIVNVMEALEAMSKTNKSFYKWHGLAALPQLMDSLQKEAIEARLPERILKVEQAMCSFTELSPMTRRSSDQVGSLVEEGQIGDHLLNHSKAAFNTANSSARSSPMIPIHSYDGTPSTHTHNDDSASDSSLHTSQQLRDRNGKNSLAQLCRRFLMVLLCNPKDKRRVSLDVASTVLIKDPENEGFEPPSRSRCRRLYDIANVLVAMGLIKKVHYLFGTKKIPLFVYCGPEPDASPSQSSMLEFLQRTGLSGVSAADSLNFSACFESPTTSLNSSAISPFSTQQMNVLAQIGGSTSNSANYFGSQPMCSTIGENWQAIQEIERMRPPAASPKTNRKRPLSDHSQTQFSSSPTIRSKENCGVKRSKLYSNEQMEDKKFLLPKPQPRMVQSSSFSNINCFNGQPAVAPVNSLQFIPPAINIAKRSSNATRFETYSMAAAAMAAAVYNQRQQARKFPFQELSPINSQSSNFDTDDKENGCQPKKFGTNGSSPKKVVKTNKFSHSVSSILGVSQAENIANNNVNNCFSSSPKAFKPVNRLLPTLPKYY